MGAQLARRLSVFGVAVVAVGAVILGANAWSDRQHDDEIDRAAKAFIDAQSSKVTYEVDGDIHAAQITLATPDGEVRRSVTLPMSVTYDFEPGTAVKVYAVDVGDPVRLSCTITDDDGIIDQAENSDPSGVICEGAAR